MSSSLTLCDSNLNNLPWSVLESLCEGVIMLPLHCSSSGSIGLHDCESNGRFNLIKDVVLIYILYYM